MHINRDTNQHKPMKNSNDIIGNRTRDLPACSAVHAKHIKKKITFNKK